MNSIVQALTLSSVLIGAATISQTQTASVAPQAVPTTPNISAEKPIPAQPLIPALSTTPDQSMETKLVIDEEMTKIIYEFPDYVPVPSWDGSITIGGSETMAPTLIAVSEAFNRLYPNVKFNIRGGGSDGALQALIEGKCDFASVSRNMSEAEINQIEIDSGKDIIEIEIGRGAACVYVNADNPITQITREQLNGIFSITHSMTKEPIFSWKELDPASPLGQEWISLYVADERSSTTRTFVDFAMPNERFTTSYFYLEPSPSSVVNACCAYKTAIGVGSFRHRQPRAKALAISADKGKTFVSPNSMTVFTSQYPLSRPLQLVAVLDKQGNLSPLLLDFVRFILSETGQDEIHEDGYTPTNPKELPAFIVRAHAAAATLQTLLNQSTSGQPNAAPSATSADAP